MWYPVHQQQQQQHSCYGYARHHPSHQQQQQQQTYLRTSYYCNTDELSTTCVEAINDENDSSSHCQTTYSGSAHGKKEMQLKFKRNNFFFSSTIFFHIFE